VQNAKEKKIKGRLFVIKKNTTFRSERKMNSVYHILIRRFSTQQNHFKLVIIGAGCGGLACASKFAKKLSKNEIAIIDKNDVCGI
jgi:ribulose 1,5-bisphosphate synthetase/thiazole synthase